MYLDTGDKTQCYGCESCSQICKQNAIVIEEDAEGFRYPIIKKDKCIQCGLCRIVCPYEHQPKKNDQNKYVFGGYHTDSGVRFNSTSGGAFSAIVDTFCDVDYVIFGAETKGLIVRHSFTTNKLEIEKFRKSKYSQSIIGDSYTAVCKFLKQGKKVLFSGTPCQIAGLLSLLDSSKTDKTNLLTVEVVCEGVPSPLYIRKMNRSFQKKIGTSIEQLDYRYTGHGILSRGMWDFQKMKITFFGNKKIEVIKDRWFNPFWSIWLNHLMSRPSCYKCSFTTPERISDITLGDLWGVHLYCPELYGNNCGSSLVICNTDKGKAVFKKAQKLMYGHELKFEDALKYQGPMRRPIAENLHREEFMGDLMSEMDFQAINNKWAKKPTLKLLIQKYVWGNRQKIMVWNFKQKIFKRW